jgi:membrane protease YdiL (CAAX protease family)
MATPLYNKGFTGWGQFGIFLGMWGVGLVAGSMVAAGVWSAMTGQGIMNMQQDMLKPQYATAIKTLQVVSTLFMFLIPALVYAFICYRNGWLAMDFRSSFNVKILGICILILVASMPTIDALALLNKAIPLSPSKKAFFDNLEKSYEEQVKVIGDVKTVGQYILSLIMIALLPALFEETLFRGGLQNLFARWWKSPWAAIIVTSILFSAIHGSWYGFFPRIGLGIILGAVFAYTHNIWYNIALHFINNATVVTIMYFDTMKNKAPQVTTESTFPWWTAFFSLAALVFLFKWIKNTSKEEAPKEIFFDRHNPFANTDMLA